jgi:hypothetical protein
MNEDHCGLKGEIITVIYCQLMEVIEQLDSRTRHRQTLLCMIVGFYGSERAETEEQIPWNV